MERAIRGCYLFAEADPRTIAILGATSTIVHHGVSQPLFAVGDPPDGFRIVLSGLVRVWIADANGRELTLCLLEADDPLGEIALLDGLPRTANASAEEAVTCLFMERHVIDEAIANDPNLSCHLIRLLCEMLRRNTDTMGAFAFLGLGGRLARKLQDLAIDHAVIEDGTARFVRRFSQADLAFMLGVTREAVNKRLATLIRDGKVRLEDGHIIVPNLAALTAGTGKGRGL